MARRQLRRFAEQAEEIRAHVHGSLGRHALREVHVEEDAWGLRMVFRNDEAGLQVEYSPAEHGGWGAVIAHLQEGVFPKHPIMIGEVTPLYRFDIRDLAAERIDCIPELASILDARQPLADSADLVHIINRCADDVLGGDFSVFEALRVRVLERAITPSGCATPSPR